MVYGCNKDNDRRELWKSLLQIKASCVDPWLVMGGFNNVLHSDERICSTVTSAETREFQDCVDMCGLYDLIVIDAYYTWNNKQAGDSRVFSRIDRVMANDSWIFTDPAVIANFLPEGLYDHSPCIISLWEDCDRKKNSFKFFNMWGKDEKFFSIVQQTWNGYVRGFKMFQLVKKLKSLKSLLNKLNRDGYGRILNAANFAKAYLVEVQTKLHMDPRNLILQTEERIASTTFKELDEAKNMFLGAESKDTMDVL
ncbi:uncharacterized protein LOC141595592 [Silene latifolia]|uniref:uncharacterized protein LOC141595592 n=1 Tax=Silene latifolia TaxID=37657 RepID=UPI003D77F6A5